MHRDNGPGDHAAGGLTLRSFPAVSLISEALSRNSFCTPAWNFLPTVVGEGSDIVENQAAVLGVELSPGRPTVPSAPKRHTGCRPASGKWHRLWLSVELARRQMSAGRQKSASATYMSQRHRSALFAGSSTHR